jgi:hypothetical protein
MVKIVIAALFPIFLFPQTDQWVIFPDGNSGAITRKTTEADLIRIYGKENVTDGEINIGEGELERGTILYPNDPNRILHVIWKNPEMKTFPKRIQLTGESSRWKTVFNITLGTTLKELEQLNRRPFRLLGFGWDYSGTVYSWSDGVLSRCCQSQGIFMRLIPAVEGEVYSRLGGQVRGDREYSSGHPAMQELNPRIYQIVFQW